MGRQGRLNRTKRLAAGAVMAVLCFTGAFPPSASYAANVVSAPGSVSSVPGFDASNPNYTGSAVTSGTQSTTGAVSGTTGSTGTTTGGPNVVEVTPTEQYYSDYDIYSESIGGQYYFYTNVANNGITDRPVSIDFPANISYTMEKDGVPTEYLSKQTVSDYGTYLFRISITEDAAKPVSDQTIYKAVYVFRIQPKVERSTESSVESEEGLRGFPGSGTSSGSSGNPSGAADWDVSALTGLPDVMRDTYRPEEFQGNSGSGSQGSSDYVDVSRDLPENPTEGTETSAAETETTEAAEAETEETSEKETSGPADQKSGDVSTVYVASLGTYRTEYPDGSAMEVTSPNGMIGNTKVYVSLEEMGENPDITALKGGNRMDLPEDGAFEEPGNYTLLVRVNGVVYPYSFRILNAADGQMDSYTLPKGIVLDAFSMDGRAIDPAACKGPDGVIRLDFTKEGSYEVKMSDPNGPDFTASLVIDRTRPEVSMTKVKGGIQFTYNKQDVSEIIVDNGKTRESYTQLSGIDQPGHYVVEFYDYAGNMTSVSAVLNRQLNMASVAAVLMIIALVVLIVVFYKRTKGEMDVK